MAVGQVKFVASPARIADAARSSKSRAEIRYSLVGNHNSQNFEMVLHLEYRV